jgi:nitroreductase
MEFETVVRRRRMVRNFLPDPIDTETIRRILDLARRGPSAGFTQGQFFVVVTDPGMKADIARLCYEEKYIEGGFDPFISGAPVLIIPCTSEIAYHRRYQERDKVQEDGTEINWPVPYWYMDVGCAVMLLLLAAVANGLAAGFAGAHDLAALRALLGIPPEVTPMGVIPMGYPADDKKSPSLKRGRKTDAEVFHWERW